ncbi:terminase large subunit domain-containing protein [Aeromonas enteropelogenes]|uniref:terminase large subunit domain-containing protein n=1 Tax=Aeromonas enteropelogenes TaxID=29489 RepID=UPI003BA385C5
MTDKTDKQNKSRPLIAVTRPRKIDLAEEAATLGVELPGDSSSQHPQGQAILLGYQGRWFEDESKFMVAEKSRRTGITWAEAARNVIKAARPKSRRGCNTFYVGSRQEMALEYIAAAALFARAFNELAQADVYEQTFWDSDKQEEILTYMLRFPNSGNKIQALSSRPSNLRGLQGDVVIDEAAFHDDLEELLKAAQAMNMWGNCVRLISTHNGTDNPFNRLVQDIREGRKEASLHRITLDDALADGLYRRICYVIGETWSQEKETAWRDGLYKNAPNKECADEEYGCVPRKGGGAYLTRLLIETAMVQDGSIPIVRYEAPEGFEGWPEPVREAEIESWCRAELLPLLEKLDSRSRYAFGEDFARVGDLSVFCPLEITPELRKRAPFVVELRNLTYDQQKQVLFYLLSRLPRFHAGAFDATGNGGYLAEAAMLRYGPDMIERVMLSQSWYQEWMPKLKAEFEAHNLEIPRHQSIVDDLMSIQVINGIPQIDKGRQKDLASTDAKAKRHGDFAVALAMAIRASWMEGGTMQGFIPLPDKRAPMAIGDDWEDYHKFEQGCW